MVLTPLLFSAGCSVTSPSDPEEGVGPVIARYTLTAEDGNPPACCAIDSAGVHITVVGGALTFHSGTFSAKPDTIDLADSSSPSSFTASVTAPTVLVTGPAHQYRDRKSTRLNSSHSSISYAVFCLK